MTVLHRPELFIEIGVEEIPVAEINPAIEYLSNSIRQLFESEHITFKQIKTFSTPRRLVLSAAEVSDKGGSSSTTYTGPRKEAAFGKDGNPTQAAIGFARSKGVDAGALQVVRLDKGEFVQVEIKKPGAQTKTLIKERLRNIILTSPFRKSMRWGDKENNSNSSGSSIRFIRPIRWLVVLYGGKVVPLTIGDVKASSFTYGLRTGSGKRIKVNGVDSWLKVMQREKILPDVTARKNIIMKQTEEMAKRVKGQAQPGSALLDAITNLVESPVAVLGSFDERFTNLPQEVIMSVMKTHQKYVPIADNKLTLMPYFIGISNNPYGDKAIIKRGYERVLTARLEDAEFYYREDIKQPLEFYAELLKGMTYYPGLGSLYDKTRRIVTIASFLCDEIKADEALKIVTLQAAGLCKADLATRLVSEFPELQGIIGKQYCLLKDPSAGMAASAIGEHRNSVPGSMPGMLISMADKADTLAGFFSIGEVPTGTQDPYGLRRAAIGILLTMLPASPDRPAADGISVNIKKLVDFSIDQYKHITDRDKLKHAILNFMYTRFEGILRERYNNKADRDNSGLSDEEIRQDIARRGVTTHDLTDLNRSELNTIAKEHDLQADLKDSINIGKLINAVLSTEPENILDADKRIHALKDIVFNPEFEPIMLAFKRVINISKNHSPDEVKPELLIEPSEKALYDKYLAVNAEVQSSLATRNYIGYIQTLEKLVPEINIFFEKVLVMSENQDIRTNRLNLLAKMKNLVMQILDITKLI